MQFLVAHITAPYVYHVHEERPMLIAIGGGPASGKTTWRCKLQGETQNYFLHDMDEVLVQLSGYQEDLTILGGRGAFEKWWPTARTLAEEQVRAAIDAHTPILYDRTCGAESSYRDLLRAKEEGYFIRLIGLTVDRSVASARVNARAMATKRVVTEEIIDEYRARFSALWPKYLAFADEAFLYDTTYDPPLLIYSSKEGVIDPVLYEKFLQEGAKIR